VVNQERFEFHEPLLKPYVRLWKLVGTGICIAVLVVTMIVLGFRGRGKRAPIPTVIAQREFAAPFLWTLLVSSIAGICLIPRFRDSYTDRSISIDGHILRIRTRGEIEAINLRLAKKASFRIMPLFHHVFKNQFHRIGHLHLLHKGRDYDFYFPVRNHSVANDLFLISGENVNA
jgi:hypothetical protein